MRLGDRVKDLNAVLIQANECIMSLMSTVLVVIPAIPFLSIMMSVASGNVVQVLAGWKFILGAYIVFTIVIIVKALKASKKTGISIPALWTKIKPAVSLAFSTSSTSSAIKMAYEISEREFNIKPEFTSFWVPMCSALFSPKTTVYLVLATCMMAQSTGVAISIPFILVLMLVTTQLSLASPGTTGALVIMFETLAMPTTSVGPFVTSALTSAQVVRR